MARWYRSKSCLSLRLGKSLARRFSRRTQTLSFCALWRHYESPAPGGCNVRILLNQVQRNGLIALNQRILRRVMRAFGIQQMQEACQAALMVFAALHNGLPSLTLIRKRQIASPLIDT